jgi:lambda family phage portal protein
MVRGAPKRETVASAFAGLKSDYFKQKREEREKSDSRDTSGVGGAKADYNAAKYSVYRRNRTGYLAMGSGADWHYRIELQYLRIMEQARDMARNDAMIGQGIERLCNNLVGDGFILNPATGDKTLDGDLLGRFTEWSRDADQCDLAGERTFHDMELDVPRQTFIDGDIVGLLTRAGSIQLVEAHRLRTPMRTRRNVVHGVLMDENRKRLEYWISKDDVDPLQQIRLVSQVDRYPVRDADGNRQVVHVFDPKRISQTRGMTALATIFDESGMWQDLNFAKLCQALAVSCFGVIRTPGKGSEDTPSVDQQYGTRTTTTQPDGSTKITEALTPGMQIQAEEGEKVEAFSPSVPNAEFFDHAHLILTLIGINIGLPLVMFLMDASETNFSGYRGAIEEARKGFREHQRWIIERFHSPVYRWKVRDFMAQDPALERAAAATGINILGHAWQPRAWPYIQPLEDAKANLLRVTGMLASPRRVTGEGGGQWAELVNECVEDRALAIRRAKVEAASINKEFNDGAPVTWHDCLTLPLPEGVTMTLQPDSEKQGAAEKAPPKKTNGAQQNGAARLNGHLA